MESTSSDGRIHAIDSCIILRFLLQDIPEQAQKAKNLILNGHDFYVDGVAIMEAVHVMTRDKWPRHNIAEYILGLLRNPAFIWDRDFFEPIFAEYLTHPSLSFDDLVLAKRIRQKGYTPLWTFDRKLANQSETAKLL